MKTKYVNVTTTAQNVDFDYVGKTDFLIQNFSDYDVTVNLDTTAEIGVDGNAIVLSKTARQLGQRGKVLSIIASEACTVEIQAVNPALFVEAYDTELGDI